VLDARWPGVSRDRIVCLEDQVPTVLLKPHLRRHFGMTPDQYRAKWRLPADYPMAAPSYVDKKREIAMRDGLGTDRRPGGRTVVPEARKRRTGKLGLSLGSAVN
jgi:predicted transcriptional regulator